MWYSVAVPENKFMIKDILKIMACIFILTTYSGAAEMEEYHAPEITVRYEPGLKGPALRIASDYKKTRN